MSEQITEYEINYACDKLEGFANMLSKNELFIGEYIKYIYTITTAARKYAKLKDALL